MQLHEGTGLGKVAITNMFGPLNKGDHELAQTLLEIIEPLSDQIQGVAFDPVLCRGAFLGEYFEQPGKATGGSKVIALVRVFRLIVALISIKVPLAVRLLPHSQAMAANAIREADTVIACPGGYLEDSRLSLYSQMVQIAMGGLSGGTLILAPMSIGPIRRKYVRSVLKSILKRADQIYVRDDASVELLDQIGIESTYSLDLAISRSNERIQDSLRGAKNKPVVTLNPYVVFTALDWGFPNADSSEVAASEYLDRCSATIELVSKLGYSVKMLVQVGSDIGFIKEIQSHQPGVEIVDPETLEQTRCLLAGAQGMIASRLHSGLLAVQEGTPTVFIAYLPKSVAAAKQLGLTESVFLIESFSPDVLVKQLEIHIKESDSFRRLVGQSLECCYRGGLDPFPDELRSNVVA